MRTDMSVAGELVADEVDLSVYPEPQESAVNTPVTQVNIGDLHANPIKLIHFLIREKVIQELAPEDYAELIRINNESTDEEMPKHFEFNQADLLKFRQILDKIKLVEPKIALVRFIGDIIADRGQNDLWIWLILGKLHQLGLAMRFLLCNHDLAFLAARESDVLHVGINAMNWLVKHNQQRSLRNLALALTPRPATTGVMRKDSASPLAAAGSQSAEQKAIADEIDAIFEAVYLPNLRVLDYSYATHPVPEGAAASHITIYTHAPVSYHVLSRLASWAEVEWAVQTPAQLMATVDAINTYFHMQRSCKPKFFNGFEFKEPITRYHDTHPLYAIAWARPSGLDTPFPLVLGGEDGSAYTLSHTHGHHPGIIAGKNNLDGPLAMAALILPPPAIAPAGAGGAAVVHQDLMHSAEYSRGLLLVYRHNSSELPSVVPAVALTGEALVAARAAEAKFLRRALTVGGRDFDEDVIMSGAFVAGAATGSTPPPSPSTSRFGIPLPVASTSAGAAGKTVNPFASRSVLPSTDGYGDAGAAGIPARHWIATGSGAIATLAAPRVKLTATGTRPAGLRMGLTLPSIPGAVTTSGTASAGLSASLRMGSADRAAATVSTSASGAGLFAAPASRASFAQTSVASVAGSAVAAVDDLDSATRAPS